MKNYELDLKNSRIDYIPQTQKKYFKYALDYSLKNDTKSVKVNRIKFYFNYEKLEVMIGTSVRNAYIYKMKEV